MGKVTEIIVILTIILSFQAESFFLSSFCKKRFEDTIMVSFVSKVIALFLLAILNAFMFLPLLFFIEVVLVSLSVIHLAKKKSWGEFVKVYFTPAYLTFMFWMILFLYIDYGKLAMDHDEFSHWMDVAKVMFLDDRLYTDPMFNCTHASYPPGMPLCIFYCEKIWQYLSGSDAFCEWIASWIHHVFCLTVTIPILREATYKKPALWFVQTIGFFVIPFNLFLDVYSNVQIDAFIGLQAGAAFIILYNKKERDCFAELLCYCMMLTLTKDVGIYFSVILAILYGLIEYLEQKRIKLKMFIPLIAVIILKVMWECKIYADHANMRFKGKIDFLEYIKLVIGKGEGWKRELIPSFFYSIVADNGISRYYPFLTWASMITILAIIILFMCYIYKPEQTVEGGANVGKKIIPTVVIIQSLVYIFNLCAVYIYKFSQVEASAMASKNRYISISVIILECFAYYVLTERVRLDKKGILILLIPIALLFVARGEIKYMLKRGWVKDSEEIRNEYNEISQKINNTVQKDEKVLLLVPETNTAGTHPDGVALRFIIRPIWLDYVTGNETEEELVELMKAYDYVIIFKYETMMEGKYPDIFIDRAEQNMIYYYSEERGGLVEADIQ